MSVEFVLLAVHCVIPCYTLRGSLMERRLEQSTVKLSVDCYIEAN